MMVKSDRDRSVPSKFCSHLVTEILLHSLGMRRRLPCLALNNPRNLHQYRPAIPLSLLCTHAVLVLDRSPLLCSANIWRTDVDMDCALCLYFDLRPFGTRFPG